MRRYFISFSRSEGDTEVVTQNVIRAENILQAFSGSGINFREGKSDVKILVVYSEDL